MHDCLPWQEISNALYFNISIVVYSDIKIITVKILMHAQYI